MLFRSLLGSAVTGVGIDRLADFICEIGPSPADRPTPVLAGGETVMVDADATAQPLVHVFKTVADPFLGQLSLFKVLSGSVKQDDRLLNSSTGAEERLHGLLSLRGKEQESIDSVVAGDIAAVAKLANTRTGDALTPKGSPVTIPSVDRHPPQFAVAITDRKSTRLNSSHSQQSRMPSSA